MLKNNSPFEYIKLSQLVASVASDLHSFDDSNLIDEDRLIKIVRKVNSDLGVRIHESKSCILDIKNYKAELPSDFWKLELIFATTTTTLNVGNLMLGGTQTETVTEYPTDLTDQMNILNYSQKINNYTPIKLGCYDQDCNQCYWVIKKNPLAQKIRITNIIPLQLNNSCNNYLTNYSPHFHNNHGNYQIDIVENIIETSFKNGQIIITYLGNMEDEEGNILIPFHPQLFPYYELSCKVKILQDLFINSEADVQAKLQYLEREKSLAWRDALNFTMSSKAKQWSDYDKKRQHDFYDKWYKIIKS